MINGLFIVIALIWIVVSQQVTYWAVITALGFRIETPVLFMEKDYLYFLVSLALFLGTVVLAFFQTLVAPWIQIVIILIARMVAKKCAQKRGCARYRQILKEMGQQHLSKGEDVSVLDEDFYRSDGQLLQQARERVKYWIG